MKKSLIEIFDVLNHLSMPKWISENIVLALSKGIIGVATELANIPKNYLNSINRDIELRGEIKRNFIKKASNELITKIDGDELLAKRILESNRYRFFDEQLNKDSIAIKMIDKIPTTDYSESEGNGIQISMDWLTAFWNLAASKSEEDMQEILSEILISETKNPNTIHLQTLQTLSILSSDIGNSFKKLCNLSIYDGKMTFFIHPNVFAFQNIGLLDEYNITLNELLDLDSAGLIRSAETLKIQYANSENGKNKKLISEEEREYQNIDYAGLKALLDVTGHQVNFIYFTSSGSQLRQLISLEPNEEYLKFISSKFGNAFKLL